MAAPPDRQPDAPAAAPAAAPPPADMEFILDIPLEVTVELGRTKLLVNELLKLGQGSVLELAKLAGETLDVLANQKLIARGEAVVINEKYGVRLTEVVSPMERVERLR
jgi:flagellar motor switch protein FliN/FliY